MTITQEEVPLEDETNVVQLRSITGGKQPPKRGHNWLRELRPWTVFLARNAKQSESELFLFQLRAKYGNACELFCFIPKEQQPHIRYFSMENFSNEYEWTETLEEGIDDAGNRPDTSGGLEVVKDTEQDNTIPRDTGQ